MQKMRVRFSLGALCIQRVGKLGTPRASGARDRWFKSSHPDLMRKQSGAAKWTGGSLLRRRVKVRVLPPELCNKRKSKPTGDGNCLEHSRSAYADLRVRLPPLPLHASLADRQRRRTSNPVRWVRFPQDTLSVFSTMSLGRRLTVSQLPLKQWYVGSIPSARAFSCEIVAVGSDA